MQSCVPWDQRLGPFLVVMYLIGSASAFQYLPSVPFGQSSQLLGSLSGHVHRRQAFERQQLWNAQQRRPVSQIACTAFGTSSPSLFNPASIVGSSGPVLVGRQQTLSLRHRKATVLKASSGEKGDQSNEDDDKLPPTVLPICLGVFVQVRE